MGTPARLRAALVALALVASATAIHAEPGERWTPERATEWYARQGRIVGFNYIPATAVNFTEMWAAETFDEQTIAAELDLAKSVGFNSMRIFLQYIVWEQDAEGLKQRMDTFLRLADERGMSTMFVFFDDCFFGSYGAEPIFGKQPTPKIGEYASGFTASPGPSRVYDATKWPQLKGYVQDLLTRFKDDRRVLAWDLYNEPTNSGMGNGSIPLLKQTIRWAREINPSQPLTVDFWNPPTPPQREATIDGSDIITFHNYGNAAELARAIEDLQRDHPGRPILCTEWLNRPRGSTVIENLPVFGTHNVAAYHWGLVNGKTQTQYPWGSTEGAPPPKVWQHDLWKGDHTPYDPAELDAFKAFIAAGTKRDG